ncbi:ABC transporter ATP-binding protein [Anaerosalibacter massiliensis]|uniref:ABC transporter ATP-binding protein/permease n=1 Tax=Anaerosalibacter massiliensis TaxID=1347392 RepID=A0A9X2S4N3_9FIRM|nr:ABC transporter ATP-binding protein [Anaerosalibacter massiliensis]MCR2043469.1 ABC transporter ATP-binding protein/permease [Anaerosalibacter massiliensis]
MEEMDHNEKINFSFWKNFLIYAKPYKKYFLFLALVMIGVAIIDAIFPLMNKKAIDSFIVNKTTVGLNSFAIKYGILVLIQAINVWFFIAIAGKIEVKMAYSIRKIGFEKLQVLPLSYYDNKAVGWLMARMTSDINRLSETISWGLVDFVWGITMMLSITVVMFSLNMKLALITLSVIPPLAIISVYFQEKILMAYRKVRKINSRITGAFNEDISGAKTTKTLVREEKNLSEFTELTSEMKDSSIRAVCISSLYLPIVLLLGSIGTALALNFGGKAVILKAISYGTLVAFINYTIQFFEPVRELAAIFAELQSAQASAERVFSLINEDLEIEDTIEVINQYGDFFNPKIENWPEIKGEVEFKNISFSYKDDEKILEDFNLHVSPGETIALVGETGSGKSTIVNLLCRFYEPNSGKILIDSVDYRKRPQVWLHENLGYVLQSPHLFSGTIMDNIRYGNLEASELDIIRASKLVNAHDFIIKLENGYDTEVGEGGSLLSTGQKQLISFARAVLRDPKIFVLDEATSSIDTETEKIIQDTIQKVLKGRTSFIIAHRLSTISNADKILVIKKGKIIESGNHSELLSKKGYYYRLYTNQFIEEKSNIVIDG